MFYSGRPAICFCAVISLLDIISAPCLRRSQSPGSYSLSVLIVFLGYFVQTRLANTQRLRESQCVWTPFNSSAPWKRCHSQLSLQYSFFSWVPKMFHCGYYSAGRIKWKISIFTLLFMISPFTLNSFFLL